jgi:DNA sulfur modification protein DndC
MKTLFDSDRTTLDDALAMTEGSLYAYAVDHPHWALAFSGGKDSSATLTATVHLIESGRVPRPKSLTILYADTRLELPNLQASAMAMLAECRRRGYVTEVVYPLLDKRWFVMMLGRGIPPSHSGFRWCTGALKVDPMADAMRRIRAAAGEKMLLITGMRVGESANRDQRIALSCGKNGGECGQGWYEQTTPAEVADVLSPLLHWRTCHVWDWLMLGGDRHGFDCRQVAEVYDQDADGSALEVLSRTGCLVCPVASKDHALDRTLRKPEWAYLAPLTRLRGIYDELTSPRSRIRKVGERKADGTLSSNPNRLGPLTMEARRKALAEVYGVQGEINRNAARLGRPPVDLINAN